MPKSLKLPEDILSPGVEKELTLAAQRKIEGLSMQIKAEIAKLSQISDDISSVYSNYVETDERIDTDVSIHNGLANLLKLIEVQNVIKLRIKRIQVMMLKIVADSSQDDLPYAIADLVREVNVGFLDSKLVRAYGEISKVMKEDMTVNKDMSEKIQFVSNDKLAIDIDEEDEEDED